MATAQKVTLTSDRVATVTALNLAVGTVTALPNTYLAAPIDLGDSLVITSSSLATPNAYTGLTFDSITNAQLSQDLAGVGAFMTGLAADTGLRWVIQTRFGYALVVKGQPVGAAGGGSGTLTGVFQIQEGSDSFTATVTTGNTTGGGAFTIPDLFLGFPAYELAFISVNIQLQEAAGLTVNQALLYCLVQIWNSDEDPFDHLNIGINTGYRPLPALSPDPVQILTCVYPIRNSGSNPDVTLSVGPVLAVAAASNTNIVVNVTKRAPYLWTVL